MLYHQSVHNNSKTRRERKHISNLIQFFHFSIFFEENEWDIHFLIFFYSKINYPITRKEQNEKTFFCIFSKIQNTFFDFDKSQIFQILMKS